MDIAYTEYFSLLNIFHSWARCFFGFEDIQSVRIKGYDGIIYINKLHSIVVTTFFIAILLITFPVKDIVILGVTNISIPMFFPSSNKSSECIRPPPRLISEMDAIYDTFSSYLIRQG